MAPIWRPFATSTAPQGSPNAPFGAPDSARLIAELAVDGLHDREEFCRAFAGCGHFPFAFQSHYGRLCQEIYPQLRRTHIASSHPRQEFGISSQACEEFCDAFPVQGLCQMEIEVACHWESSIWALSARLWSRTELSAAATARSEK